eukprot:2207822-Ditylum_brightwellii.AAC.1
MEGLNVATKAFDPYIGAIKGQTTRKQPTLMTSNGINIPDKLLYVNRDVTMFNNGIMYAKDTATDIY